MLPGSSVTPKTPAWFRSSCASRNGAKRRLLVNGQEQQGVAPEHTSTIEREWKLGDIVEIYFDMPVIAHKLEHNIAFTRGPVLLARDSRFGDGDFTEPFRQGIRMDSA